MRDLRLPAFTTRSRLSPSAQAYYDRCLDVRRVPAKRTALGFPVCPAHGLPAPSPASPLGSAASGGFQGVLLAGMRERDDPLSDERPTQYDLAIVQCGAAGQPLQVGKYMVVAICFV